MPGDKDSISGQGRENWREVILKERLLAELKRINVDANGKPWLDDIRLNQAWRDLDRLTAAPGHSLMEKNQTATALLLEGTVVEGFTDWNAGRNQRIQYIECKSPATTNPIEEGINQLLRYSNQRHWLDAREGNEKLFYYAQLLIVTDYDDARMACPGAQFEHTL